MKDNCHITNGVAPDCRVPASSVHADLPGFRKSVLHLVPPVGAAFSITVFTLCAWVWTVLPLPPGVTALVGFCAGLLLFVPGIWLASHRVSPGKSLMGGGMAFLFLTASALVFRALPDGGLKLLPSLSISGPVVCGGLIILFGIIAYRTSSQTAGLLVCLFSAYLANLVLPGLSPLARGYCLSLSSLLLAGWLCLWLAGRRASLFTPFALAFIYALNMYGNEAGFGADNTAFALVILALCCIYAAVTLLIVHHSAESGTFIAGAAAVNGLGFGISVWHLASSVSRWAWLSPAVLIIAGLCVAAMTYRRQALKMITSFYVSQTVAALMFLILMHVPAGPNLLLVALLGLLPALAGFQPGGSFYRYTEYSMICVVIAASFLVGLPGESLQIGPFYVSLYWIYITGTVIVLSVIACIHYRHANHLEQKQSKDHDRHYLLSIAQGGSAALLLMMHTILRRNDSESLPLLFALQGFLFLGLGMVFLTPRLALLGLAPVIAGHVCYYVFPFLFPSAEGIPAETHWQGINVLWAATLPLALLSDWFLSIRKKTAFSKLERALALLPYIPLLLPLLSIGDMPLIYWPPALTLSFFAILGITRASSRRLPGLETIGFAGLLFSVGLYLYALFLDTLPACDHNGFLPALGLYVISLIILERITFRNIPAQPWLSAGAVAFIVLLGTAGLYAWNNHGIYALALFGLALIMTITGYIFHAKIYRNAAVLLLVLAAAWAIWSYWN